MHLAVVGDIHGRFGRVDRWLGALERALETTLDLVLAVGDVEAYVRAEHHRERAARRAMAPEYGEYAKGAKALDHEMYFIGGNNEDFAALHGHAHGATIPGGMHYLGRAGTKTLAGLHFAWLSGIMAPRFIDAPIAPPDTELHRKQAGYFRRAEIDAVRASAHDIDIMLVHEWPRGLVARARAERAGIHRRLRAYRTPWIGNPETRALVEAVAPKWLFCGHSHIALASTLGDSNAREVTNVVCLDQAARPGGAVFWMEWSRHKPLRAGWGVDGSVCWRAGEAWDEGLTPIEGDEGEITSQSP